MRSSILDLLRQAEGAYISGEEIARQLSVSRTAVWKHMHELKLAGYAIESHSRSGYRLLQTPDLLLPNEIKNGLATKTFGREIKYYKEVVSTNNEAKQWAAQGVPEGTIIVSEAQNGGRGRLSRGWFSPPQQGIWFSLILRPGFLPQEAPKCTLLAAVAIVKAIQSQTGIVAGIKWPNDILYQGKKLVGILTEMSAEMDGINYIVIGSGINVNTKLEEFPEELRPIAASLAMIAGKEFSRLELLRQVLLELETLYGKVRQEGFAPVLAEWRKNSVTLGDRKSVV